MAEHGDQQFHSSISKNPIYKDRSSCMSIVNKIYGIVTALVVIITIILCSIKGKNEPEDYLLVANIVCTSFVCLVHVLWYRSSSLAEEKVWFLFVIYTVLMLQCITSDIYVYINANAEQITSTPTPIQSTTNSHLNTTLTTHHTPLTTTTHPKP